MYKEGLEIRDKYVESFTKATFLLGLVHIAIVAPICIAFTGLRTTPAVLGASYNTTIPVWHTVTCKRKI